VLLLEAGGHYTAADHMRWEARANRELWWPPAIAEPATAADQPLLLLRGRCVGGTTTINTKVALRPPDEDYVKWHAASGLRGESGEPFAATDLENHFERVEATLGVRPRTDWQGCVRQVQEAFAQLGGELEPVDAYTDANCMRCGSCLQGCPTNAGKSTLNTWIHPPWADGRLELRAGADVRRVLVSDTGDGPIATGVRYADPTGATHEVHASAVVVAAGALATPGLLIRSGLGGDGAPTASGRLVGRHLGFHPARLVEGLFDTIQDAHMVYPITSHCMAFQRDADGGFVIEASTIQDPIAFATALRDERDRAVWGDELVELMRSYRHFNGLLTMVSDCNHGRVWVDRAGRDRFTVAFDDVERERNERALAFARQVLERSGARRVFHTGLMSTHVQGGCRMGSDPERSVVDGHGECHHVRRLFLGDSSVMPATIAVNPSLTIMALADRLASYLDADERGYLGQPSTVTDSTSGSVAAARPSRAASSSAASAS
jgi:choline dehydrogenase-like flavoprotein